MNKELIRREIERRKNKAGTMRERGAYLDILSFLDTLEEPVSDDLEEAAETKYPTRWKKYPNDGIVRSEEYFDLNAEKRDAFKAGAERMKAKMMEGAVEGSCIEDLTAGSVIDTEYGVLYLPPDKFRFGDKVKIIIVKEDER